MIRRSDRIEPARPTLSAEHPRICGNARTCGTRDVTASSSAYLRSGTRNCGAVQGRPARPLPLCVIFRRSSLDKLSLYTAVTGAPLVPSFPLFPPRRHYIIYTPLENPPRAPPLRPSWNSPSSMPSFVFAPRPSAISTLKRAYSRSSVTREPPLSCPPLRWWCSTGFPFVQDLIDDNTFFSSSSPSSSSFEIKFTAMKIAPWEIYGKIVVADRRSDNPSKW